MWQLEGPVPWVLLALLRSFQADPPKENPTVEECRALPVFPNQEGREGAILVRRCETAHDEFLALAAFHLTSNQGTDPHTTPNKRAPHYRRTHYQRELARAGRLEQPNGLAHVLE